MAMQFWKEKRRLKRNTLFCLFVYFVLACMVAYLFEVVIRYFAEEGYSPPMPYLGYALFAFICVVSCFYYFSYATIGGSVVPESMGGIEMTAEHAQNPKIATLLNLVDEITIASRLPKPRIYLIEANEINAFAAGLKPEKSIIAVTTGALNSLSREELEGVLAHEFGHISTGDMRLGLRLSALLMGFFIVFYLGLRLFEGSLLFGSRGKNGGRGNSTALIALLLLAAGLVLWFAGTLLRACVSRQREYMADASAVEFTRNPNGIASALKRIQSYNKNVQDMPKSGLGYAHLYFDNQSFWSRLFATHPPIEKRIKALIGKEEIFRD